MDRSIEESKLVIESAVVAYLLAITSAAITFPAFRLIFEMLTIMWYRGLDGTAVISILMNRQHYPINMLLEGMVVWVIALFSALLPYILGIVVARNLRLVSWQYFVMCGVVIAAVLGFTMISIISFGFEFPNLGPALWGPYIRALPIYIACGSVAGAVCWLYLRRSFTWGAFGNLGQST